MCILNVKHHCFEGQTWIFGVQSCRNYFNKLGGLQATLITWSSTSTLRRTLHERRALLPSTIKRDTIIDFKVVTQFSRNSSLKQCLNPKLVSPLLGQQQLLLESGNATLCFFLCSVEFLKRELCEFALRPFCKTSPVLYRVQLYCFKCSVEQTGTFYSESDLLPHLFVYFCQSI